MGRRLTPPVHLLSTHRFYHKIVERYFSLHYLQNWCSY